MLVKMILKRDMFSHKIREHNLLRGAIHGSKEKEIIYTHVLIYEHVLPIYHRTVRDLRYVSTCTVPQLYARIVLSNDDRAR